MSVAFSVLMSVGARNHVHVAGNAKGRRYVAAKGRGAQHDAELARRGSEPPRFHQKKKVTRYALSHKDDNP